MKLETRVKAILHTNSNAHVNSFTTAGRFGIGVALFEEITMQIKTKED